VTTDMTCNLFAAQGTNALRRINELGSRLEVKSSRQAGLSSLSLQEVHSYKLMGSLIKRLGNILPYYAYYPGLVGPAGGLVTFAIEPVNFIEYISFGPATSDLGLATIFSSLAFGAAHKGILVTESGGVYRINFHLSPNHFADWDGKYRVRAVQTTQLAVVKRTVRSLRNVPRLAAYGDSNILTPGPLFLNFLADTGLVDAFPGHEPTFSGRGKSACLDWMLFGGALSPKVSNAKVLWANERRSTRYIRQSFPSDHSPLIATAEWE
jgi:hypothetical protein